jgi:hypothetical protein
MIPLLKIFSILAKVLSRPLMNYLKEMTLKNKDHYLNNEKVRNFFYYFGKRQSQIENKIDSMLLKKDNDALFFVKRHTDEFLIL